MQINNSWGEDGGSQELEPDSDPFYKMMVYLNSLGIISLYAAGNSGPGCGSMVSPGSYNIVYSVGAVDVNGTVAYFSARGPSIIHQTVGKNSGVSTTSEGGTCTKRAHDFGKCANSAVAGKQICEFIKPEIMASGRRVNSSVNTNVTDYEVWSGTSMATPHVTGVVALMISENLKYSWNQKSATNVLTTTANTTLIDNAHGKNVTDNSFERGSFILCNFVTSKLCNNKFPNNVYGHGIVDACAAVKLAKIM